MISFSAALGTRIGGGAGRRRYEQLDRRTLIDVKRREPADGPTSVLIAARVEDEEPLGEQERVDMLLLLIGGGSQTAVSPRVHRSVPSLPMRWAKEDIDRADEDHITFGAGPHLPPRAVRALPRPRARRRAAGAAAPWGRHGRLTTKGCTAWETTAWSAGASGCSTRRGT